MTETSPISPIVDELWERRDGLSPADEDARQQVVADEAFGRDAPYAVVAQINEAIAVGDWTLYADYRARIEAVTAADVQASLDALGRAAAR